MQDQKYNYNFTFNTLKQCCIFSFPFFYSKLNQTHKYKDNKRSTPSQGKFCSYIYPKQELYQGLACGDMPDQP